MTDILDSDRQLINLIANRFIQRPSPIAIQTSDGGYMPLRDRRAGTETGITPAILAEHLSGFKTYGHYLIDSTDKCKLFVIDIDLAPSGYVPTIPLDISSADDTAIEAAWITWRDSFQYVPDLRATWHDRSNLPARAYLKQQMRILAAIFVSGIYTYMQIPCAAAYSGNKGIHVYGFTGTVSSQEAHGLAEIAMGIPQSDNRPYWEPFRGSSMYRDSRFDYTVSQNLINTDTLNPSLFFNWQVEKYPKQPSLENKDLGNLIRLPLGKNKHNPSDPTFFIDLTTDYNTFRSVDPVHALTVINPFANLDTSNQQQKGSTSIYQETV